MKISNTIIEIPIFTPEYEAGTSYGYKGMKGNRLLDVLYKASNGYCMYCYTRIEVDSKRFGQLEHSIERKYTKKAKKLENCVPNISVACPKCNLSFKKKGNTSRVLTPAQIQEYEESTCIGDICTTECEAYKKLKKQYIGRRKIILQPAGIASESYSYKIQYNLLKLEFEPNTTEEYTQEENNFIRQHIKQFNLNDSQYRTREILRCCEDIINGDITLRKGKYNNYIVDLFMDKLEGLSSQDKIKLCTVIYTIGKSKRII